MSLVGQIVALDESDPTTPEEGLLMQVKWSKQVSIALAKVIEAMVGDEQLTVPTSATDQRYHALMQAWNEERDRHARYCKLALDAGIQQRQLDLVEAQANQIVSAMLALLMNPRLNLTGEQIIEGRIVAAKILRSLPGQQALPIPLPA